MQAFSRDRQVSAIAVLPVRSRSRRFETTKWCKFVTIFKILVNFHLLIYIYSTFSLCPKISARLLSAQSIQITRRLPANSGRRPVNASLEKAAPSSTAKKRGDASSIPYPTCQRALPSHQCRRNSRNRDTIMGTRVTIITITTAIIPLIIPATILTPITRPTSM